MSLIKTDFGWLIQVCAFCAKIEHGFALESEAIGNKVRWECFDTRVILSCGGVKIPAHSSEFVFNIT